MPDITLSDQIIGQLSNLDTWTAYLAVFSVLIICGLGVPFPEDITLLATGFLAAIGKISLLGGNIVCFAGVLLGDSFIFFMGRKYGRRALQLRFLNRILTEDRIRLAEKKIHHNAHFICFVARFLPGLRTPLYFTAGMLRVRPAIFITQDGLAALISVPLWIFVGYWFGTKIDAAFEYAHQIQFYLWIGLAVLIGVYILYRFRQRASINVPTNSPAQKR